MTTPRPTHPTSSTSGPNSAASNGPTAPVRRVLTDDDLRAIHAAASAATSPAQLLRDTLAALGSAVRPPTGRGSDASGDDSTGDADPSAPSVNLSGYAIPISQWNAIFNMITGRAGLWGLAAEIGLDLATNLLPASYDDPDPRLVLPALTDLRPTEHHLRLTHSAIEAIAECRAHLWRLSSHYHPASPAYRQAADSWNELLTVLLTGYPDARVTGYGNLGLLVESAGGTAWALTYRPKARRCTTSGCHAVIDDDATAHAPRPDAPVLDHHHVPSYPVDGPAPGQWTVIY
ncbi:MAG: hypothetical protein QG597_5242 [Actinomycetota bacterium]|nr:hypothetical protein [Actinomycetota bacterium]